MKAGYNKELQTFNKALTDKLNQLSTAVEPATDTKAGTVLQGVAVADATDAATVITQCNALLASLRAAGVIET